MASLVVGSEDCPLKKVAAKFFTDATEAGTTERWKELGSQLLISREKLNEFEDDLLIEKITIQDLISEILAIWCDEDKEKESCDKEKSSSVGKLICNLEAIEWRGVSDVLKAEFGLDSEYGRAMTEARRPTKIKWKM